MNVQERHSARVGGSKVMKVEILYTESGGKKDEKKDGAHAEKGSLLRRKH